MSWQEDHAPRNNYERILDGVTCSVLVLLVVVSFLIGVREFGTRQVRKIK